MESQLIFALYRCICHSEKQVDEIYEKIDTETKGKDYTMVMGDFSATVGKGMDKHCVGNYGFGHRNEKGQKLGKCTLPTHGLHKKKKQKYKTIPD